MRFIRLKPEGKEHVVRIALVCAVLLIVFTNCAPAPRYTTGKRGETRPVAPSRTTTPGKPAPEKPGRSAKEPAESFKPGMKFRGIASYYADEFHEKKTSNGESFNMHGLTCAHKTLPFNTWLEVRNLANGRTVIVRVNDRGPFIEGRIIDLSLGAAKELGMVLTGIQEVEIEILSLPENAH